MILKATDGATRAMAATMLGTLFEQYQQPIFAYLARLVDDSEWAEELAADAFRAALRAGDQLPGIAGRRAWLYRIATGTAFSALQRDKRSRRPPRALASMEDDRGQAVGRRGTVEKALSTLPAEQRAPLLLYSHCGLSIAEVAEVLGAGEGAAKTRLHEARTLFRAAYEREVQGAEPR